MEIEATPLYSIEELAELGGVTRRTVRYYVGRGLIPQPTGTGRGKHYTQAHLDALLRVKQLQEDGQTLSAILDEEPVAPRPHPPPAPLPAEPAQEPWTRVVLDDGVELHLRGPRSALTSDVLDELRRYLRQILNRP